MFGVFDFIEKTCVYFIEKEDAPSFELTIALYQMLHTPEFDFEMKYLSETNPEKMVNFIKILMKALKDTDKNK
jgi:hypothetical protein